MAIISGGELALIDNQSSFGGISYQYPSQGIGLVNQYASYAAIYKRQVKVYAVVNKLAYNVARLPLKVYERGEEGRDEARDSAFARLLRKPNPKHDPFFLWLWTASTFFIYGEAIWLKSRNPSNGEPSALWPLHPTNVTTKREGNTVVYKLTKGPGGVQTHPDIPDTDIVHFRMYSADDGVRGLSPIEPLRATLQNEDAARRASAAFWQNGGRPSVLLKHPKTLSDNARIRLTADWQSTHSGVDNFGKAAILEEGMDVVPLMLNAEEAQYIESRQLNELEVHQTYDISPIAMHVLRFATYANVVEGLRSVYRDCMAPKLGLLESTIDTQLRPEFAKTDNLYAEFLMDEVLRGSFEERATATQKYINSGQLTPNEGRKLENRPPLPGGDELYINGNMLPVSMLAEKVKADLERAKQPKPAPPQQLALPVADEPLALPAGTPAERALRSAEVRKVMGRLGRVAYVKDTNVDELVEGLNGTGAYVRAEWARSLIAGETVGEFKTRLHALES